MNDSDTSSRQLEDFVESVLREKNLPGVTEDVLPDLITETTSQLRELIDMAVVDAMSPEAQENFDALLQNPDTTIAGVSDFIAQSGVDVPQVAADTMTRFRELYLQGPETKS